MADLVETLIAAVAIGSLYALIALGYTLVYGVLKFINFAHADVVVWGAWIGYVLARRLLPLWGFDPRQPQPAALWMTGVILVAVMLACGLLGLAIEWLAYRPLRKAPRLNVLITAIGISLLLQNVGQLSFVFGANPERMPALLPDWVFTTPALGFGASARPVTVDFIDLANFGTTAVLLIALEGLIFHTKLGTALRAISFDADAASLLGINVNRLIAFTFVLGSMLAGAAGFLHAAKYPGLNQPAHETWVFLGLKAFVAAVVGGIGNVRGAVAGGFIIAFVEQFGAHYLSPYFRDVYVFGLLIGILLVRPTGIFGAPAAEKV